MASAGGIRYPDDIWICSNTSLRRSEFLGAGGFMPSMHTHEDAELAIRLWKRGLSFSYLPEAAAEYLYSKGARELVRDKRSYGETEVRLCEVHPEYRAVSGLPRLGRGPAWKRTCRALVVGAPFDLTRPMCVLAALADCAVDSRFERAADRVMRFAGAVVFLQAAGRAAGGWAGLRRRFGADIDGP
jgi:hypothetical protein